MTSTVAEDGAPRAPLDINQALSYIDKVKNLQPDKFQQFSITLESYRMGSKSISEVTAEINSLFEENPNLIEDFKKFLPDRESRRTGEGQSNSRSIETEPILRTVLPNIMGLEHARKSLIAQLPEEGIGQEATLKHIWTDITPALNACSQSPNYYGFVTGGVTPVAALADNIVTQYDQNVQVHLPNETIATEVEWRALDLLCELLGFASTDLEHRTFTTGATASNILGLACGRQFVVENAALKLDPKLDVKKASVAEVGVGKAMRLAELEDIQVLTTMPHSSLRKAASVVGLGRNVVKLISRTDAPHKFDMRLLEAEMSRPKIGSIVVISCGEVNTGYFATTGDEMQQIRNLCNKYGAWLHVDGAFGLMGRLLDPSGYPSISEGCKNIELADSITGDGHKLLNVPYDCGFFLGRHARIGYEVFQNQGAAYLSSAALDESGIISPLHIGIENSRRFRALPVYATLVAYGYVGYRDMLKRQIELAKRIATFIAQHDSYELLPVGGDVEDTYIIVLFRANDKSLNEVLVERINATLKIYCSATTWDGAPACRFAVSNWQANVERDFDIVSTALSRLSEAHTTLADQRVEETSTALRAANLSSSATA